MVHENGVKAVAGRLATVNGKLNHKSRKARLLRKKLACNSGLTRRSRASEAEPTRGMNALSLVGLGDRPTNWVRYLEKRGAAFAI